MDDDDAYLDDETLESTKEEEVPYLSMVVSSLWSLWSSPWEESIVELVQDHQVPTNTFLVSPQPNENVDVDEDGDVVELT